MKISFSLEAEQDLVTLFVYSIEQFGETQAKKYYKELQNVFQIIADNPQIGKSLDYLDLDFLVFFHQKQAIFYRLKQEENLLEIVRVISQNRDYVKILK